MLARATARIRESAHIFTEYAYFSSYSTSWVAHAKRYCEMMKARLNLGEDSFVVELGSNDGYLLQHFLALGQRVLGIEPAANVAETARARGIPTLTAFFNTETARQVVAQYGHADLIVANNVLAQVPELNDFVAGMALLLGPEGVITVEVPHLERLIAENQFDTIYHEHFSYFSLLTVQRIAAASALVPIDVEVLPTHGGSLRIYLAHRGSGHPVSLRVANMLAQERGAHLDKLSAYADFASRVQRTKRDLLAVLIAAKELGQAHLRLWCAGQGQYLAQLLRNWTGLPGLHSRPQPIQARPLYAWHAHSDQASGGDRRSTPGLHSNFTLEPEAGNRGTDAPRRNMGWKVPRSHPRDRHYRPA